MPDEPQSRGVILIGLRAAVLARWGQDGLTAIAARLSNDARAATIGALVGAHEWVPTRYLLEWHQATYSGPARSSEADYRAFVDDSVDLGFWRVQRILLKIATPMMLVERSAKLWRHHHSHGTLEIVQGDPREGHELTGTLRDHPLTASVVSRLTLAEALRHIMSMARAKNVRETHAPAPDPRTLVFKIRWE